jgi:uncharacterized membrane protein YkvI
LQSSLFQRILLPGFLLQSVIIGGGYATGRELVEFFLNSGPAGGLLGMLIATTLFSVASALSFELARMSRSYNYRNFFRQLLGKGWFVYEIAYFALGLLVLAVVGAAAGELVQEHLGLPKAAGTLLLMVATGLLVFRGSSLMEKVLAGWSFLLYATYAVLVACYLWRFGGDLVDNMAQDTIRDGWFGKGFAYFGYNVAVIPIVLFCVRHLQSRRDAFTAGALAGPLIMAPAILFYLAMAATYPAILDAAVPADFMTQRLGFAWLNLIFYVVVFGTFVETGAAFIHAVNERIAEGLWEKGRVMPSRLRSAIALLAMIVAVVLAVRIGLIDLIVNGYGTLTWVFIAVFVIPLCTVGVWKIRQQNAAYKVSGKTPVSSNQ